MAISLARAHQQAPKRRNSALPPLDASVGRSAAQRTSVLPCLGRTQSLPARGAEGFAQSRSAFKPRLARHGTPGGTAAGGRPAIDGLDAVLFLDVDGVLHPVQARHPRQQFVPANMQLLSEIVERTGAKIVLSTAWRLDEWARRTVAERLREHDVPMFVSRTPNVAQFHRHREILSWVKQHCPKSWVALDDWPLLEGCPAMASNFVQTRPRFGLQRDTADKVLGLFQQQQAGPTREATPAGRR